MKFYFILILIFCSSISFAQDDSGSNADSAVVSPEPDSANMFDDIITDTSVTKALFDENNDSLLKWKHSREFGYMAYLDSLLRKKTGLKSDTTSIDENTGRKRRIRFSSSNGDDGGFLNSLPLRIFFWTIAIFFICFIIYKLFLTGGLFARKLPGLLMNQLKQTVKA